MKDSKNKQYVVMPTSNLPQEVIVEQEKGRKKQLEETKAAKLKREERQKEVKEQESIRDQERQQEEWESSQEKRDWDRRKEMSRMEWEEAAKKYGWGYGKKQTTEQGKEWYDKYWQTKKSLDNLLQAIGNEDDIIIKTDVGLILESANTKQKKTIKTLVQHADPTEFFGHDFLKLGDLIKTLKALGVVKGEKKLNKKILNYEDENLKVVKLASKLRKDYEALYNNLRKLVYPKEGASKNE